MNTDDSVEAWALSLILVMPVNTERIRPRKKVHLYHGGNIPYYRVPVYGALTASLSKVGYDLLVVSEGLDDEIHEPVPFTVDQRKFTLRALVKYTNENRPDAAILFINHSKMSYFPFLLFLRSMRIPAITWTHGIDLQHKGSRFSALAHHMEHEICDGIIAVSYTHLTLPTKRIV